MTKREAMALVCRLCASELSGHRANGSEFLTYDDANESYSPADQQRIYDAFEKLVDELDRRGERSK